MKAISWVYSEVNKLIHHKRDKELCSVIVPVSADRKESISHEADIYMEIYECVRTNTLIIVIIYSQTGWN